MKNKKITITSAEINTQTIIKIDCGMEITSGSHYDKATPQHIYFYNSSGEDVEFNFISENEILEFEEKPTRFIGFRIGNNETFKSWEILGPKYEKRIHYLLIKGLGAGAGSNLNIYGVNYL